MASMHNVEFYDKCRDQCESCKQALKECYEYMANPKYLKKALTYNINEPYIVKMGDMFQEFSRRISHLAVDNYLHDVVMPGVPDFKNSIARVKFWAKVCINKLKATYPYFKKEELKYKYNNLQMFEKILKK